MKTFSLSTLADLLGIEYRGDEHYSITGLATLSEAGPSDLSFLAKSSYKDQLETSKAGVVILKEEDLPDESMNALITDDPYLIFAKVTQLFDNRPKKKVGIHPSAHISDTATIGEDCSIAANVVIGENVTIGKGCEIGAGTVIGDDSSLGDDCHLNANVTLYHNVHLDDRVCIHSGSIIGADGFGFAPKSGEWEKIIQLGGVRIGHDVEIGANSCVDRGALDDTVIGNHVIIDNLVQIAHGVVMGDSCAAAAQTGIAGSTKIGKNCIFAGNSGVAGHLEIVDNVFIGAKAAITRSILEPGAYSSGTTQMPLSEWKKSTSRFKQLDALARRIQDLENREEE